MIIFGYVVLRGGYVLGSDTDGILWGGGPGKLFFRYERARQAVRRTQRYAKRMGFKCEENVGPMEIVSLEL